jgi:hypothetical protein
MTRLRPLVVIAAFLASILLWSLMSAMRNAKQRALLVLMSMTMVHTVPHP